MKFTRVDTALQLRTRGNNVIDKDEVIPAKELFGCQNAYLADGRLKVAESIQYQRKCRGYPLYISWALES